MVNLVSKIKRINSRLLFLKSSMISKGIEINLLSIHLILEAEFRDASLKKCVVRKK